MVEKTIKKIVAALTMASKEAIDSLKSIRDEMVIILRPYFFKR